MEKKFQKVLFFIIFLKYSFFIIFYYLSLSPSLSPTSEKNIKNYNILLQCTLKNESSL